MYSRGASTEYNQAQLSQLQRDLLDRTQRTACPRKLTALRLVVCADLRVRKGTCIPLMHAPMYRQKRNNTHRGVNSMHSEMPMT